MYTYKIFDDGSLGCSKQPEGTTRQDVARAWRKEGVNTDDGLVNGITDASALIDWPTEFVIWYGDVGLGVDYL